MALHGAGGSLVGEPGGDGVDVTDEVLSALTETVRRGGEQDVIPGPFGNVFVR
jgi:hypothetical protein